MTHLLIRDKAWLIDEIETAVDGFLDLERDILIDLITKRVFEQIFMSACAANTDDSCTSEATLQINIPIPDPDACAELIDGFRPITDFTKN